MVFVAIGLRDLCCLVIAVLVAGGWLWICGFVCLDDLLVGLLRAVPFGSMDLWFVMVWISGWGCCCIVDWCGVCCVFC